MAIKATNVVINGESIPIFKDPKTDDGLKKSAKGLLMVTRLGDDYSFKDECTPKEEKRGCLESVFKNGVLLRDDTLEEIRNRGEI